MTTSTRDVRHASSLSRRKSPAVSSPLCRPTSPTKLRPSNVTVSRTASTIDLNQQMSPADSSSSPRPHWWPSLEFYCSFKRESCICSDYKAPYFLSFFLYFFPFVDSAYVQSSIKSPLLLLLLCFSFEIQTIFFWTFPLFFVAAMYAAVHKVISVNFSLQLISISFHH